VHDVDLHEYSVIGHSRALLGQKLAIVAGLLTTAVTSIGIFSIHLLQNAGLSRAQTLAIPPIGGVVTAGIFWAFNEYGWRVKPIRKLLKLPDLEGTWNCIGRRLDDKVEGTSAWSSTIFITQTWEKISITQQSDQGSASWSQAASLMRKPTGEFVLMYSYFNDPDISHPNMSGHRGYCELTFDTDIRQAKGFYFNNKGRISHGEMQLTKI
jgi:hypothetical protein